jgi:hypothetical protein
VESAPKKRGNPYRDANGRMTSKANAVYDVRFNKAHDKLGRFAKKPDPVYTKLSDVPHDHTATVAAKLQDTGENVHNELVGLGPTNWSDPRDHSMAGMAKITGMDGKPTKGDVDGTIAAGGREIHRGILPFRGAEGIDPKSSEEIIDGFKNGPYEPGTGNHGSGFYFTTSPEMASYYAKGPVAREGFRAKPVKGGKTYRAALKPDAKVIDYGDLQNLQKTWFTENKSKLDNEYYKHDYKAEPGKIHPAILDHVNSPGAFAAMMGYDAIEVPLQYRTDRRYKKRLQKLIGSEDLGNEIVVINRGALVVGDD